MDNKKLLAVLDMSEDEQWDWVFSQHAEVIDSGDESLADLAFRLRDETVSTDYKSWCEAVDVVLENSARGHWIDFSRPIDWIIAALIAKGEKP